MMLLITITVEIVDKPPVTMTVQVLPMYGDGKTWYDIKTLEQ